MCETKIQNEIEEIINYTYTIKIEGKFAFLTTAVQTECICPNGTRVFEIEYSTVQLTDDYDGGAPDGLIVVHAA